MSFEVTGKLHKIFDTEQKTDSFRAREFVVEIEQGNYPQFVKFQLVQDRCDLIEPYEVGTDIKVFFDLRGREWNEKYFTNLNAWRIEEAGAEKKMDPLGTKTTAPEEAATGATESTEMQAEDFDDLPF